MKHLWKRLWLWDCMFVVIWCWAYFLLHENMTDFCVNESETLFLRTVISKSSSHFCWLCWSIHVSYPQYIFCVLGLIIFPIKQRQLIVCHIVFRTYSSINHTVDHLIKWLIGMTTKIKLNLSWLLNGVAEGQI